MRAFYRIAACDARESRTAFSELRRAPAGAERVPVSFTYSPPPRTPATDADKLRLGGTPNRRLT
jgi:hypothetical protein